MGKKKPEEATKPVFDLSNPDFWQSLKDTLSVGSGNHYYLKDGKNKLRLLVDNTAKPFAEVQTFYRGAAKTKYMILGFVADQPDLGIKGIVVPRSVLTALVDLQIEDYGVFDEEGHGVVVMKVKEGNRTNYSVLPSRKPQPIPDSIAAELATTSLQQFADEFNAFQEARESSQDGAAATEEDVEETAW